MALEKRTRLYEILVRFGADGLQAAHVIDIEEIYEPDTGKIVAATETNARAITVEEAGDYLGKAAAKAVKDIADREKALEQRQNDHSDAMAADRASLDEQAAELAVLRDKLASVAASIMATI